jgi:hypothetical protein
MKTGGKVMNKSQREEFRFIKKSMKDTLKEVANKYGCKKYSDCVYKKMEPYFASVCFLALFNSDCQIRTWAEIKLYAYDNIFWDVFDMKENISQSDSLRAMGAFAAPSVTIYNKTITIPDKLDVARICDENVKEFLDKSQNYITWIESQYENFDNYVIKTDQNVLLKILAQIHLGNYVEAQKMAEDELQQGRTGAFRNRGIWINEYIVQYCSKTTSQ